MPTREHVDREHEELSEADCRRLIADAQTGRLGFSDGALPAILPVSFAVDDDEVVIPADRTGEVVAALRGSVVVLEVGAWSADSHTGWSVTLVGPTRLITHADDVARLDALSGAAPAPGRRYLAIRTGLLRGWRTHPRPARHLVAGAAGD